MKRKCHKYKGDTTKKKESHYIKIATYICFLSFCQPWHWPDPWICHYFNNGALTGEISTSTNSIAPSKHVLFFDCIKPLLRKSWGIVIHSFMALMKQVTFWQLIGYLRHVKNYHSFSHMVVWPVFLISGNPYKTLQFV